MSKKIILDAIKNHYKFKSNTEFAAFLGIAPQTLSSWYSRDSIDYDLIYAKCVDIDANWLITGQGEMLKSDSKSKNYSQQLDTLNQVSESEISIYKLKTDYYGVERQMIPLYEIDASAGLNMLFSNQNTQIPLDYITVPNAPKCDGALFVRGDSMYPLLKAGDIICYKTIQNIENIVFGEMYLLDLDNGDDQYLTVKYVQKSEKGDKYIKLVSENKYHADKDEPVKNIRTLGIVKLTIRYNTIS